MNKLATLLILLMPVALLSQGLKPKPTFSDQPNGTATLKINPALDLSVRETASHADFHPVAQQWKQATDHLGKSNQLMQLNFSQEELKNLNASSKVEKILAAVLSEKDLDPAHFDFIQLKQRGSITGEHFSLDQSYKGLPIFGAEIKIHLLEDESAWALGRLSDWKKELNVTPTFDQLTSLGKIKTQLADVLNWQELSEKQLRFIPNNQQATSALKIFLTEAGEAHLVWHFSVHPNLRHRWEVFLDAQSGQVIHHFASHCQLWAGDASAAEHNCSHAAAPAPEATNSEELLGPVTAQALDLFNVNRNINVYQEGTAYYMIDASRNMFNAGLSDFPDDPNGVIWTLDAKGGSPQNDNFSVSHVGSTNNQWNDKVSVSAHYNGGVAYEYFRTTHSRNSINGQGGNVISLVNVTDADGSDMDNAFWNGAAMFYGNGNQAFNAPLAKGLDVAGHELSHGVIQNEANLAYQNQSGALNESFADIFGAMIDRDDWLIGEDISNPSVFPSGSMRSMQDPHNGGNSNNFYWQPKHMNEFVNLPNTQQGDFGGVHINSGIPNHAYYKFAEAVGKDKAEDVYYEVLANYLVSSSQFVDLRIAVLTVAEGMFGPTVSSAAATAFNEVGIGEGPGNDYQQDDPLNPGEEFVLWADGSDIGLYLPDGQIANLSGTDQASRPSITDDGSVIVFIDSQNRIKIIEVDYNNLSGSQEYFLENNPQTIWRNIAISKDASKLALLTTDQDNELLIYHFDTNALEGFELINPTTSNPGTGQNVNTGDVKYADVMEWDLSGEYVMYDAFNELSSGFSEDISYWDIGLIRVWNNNANNFDAGTITKLFNGLSENESIGNPTWSKNSQYVIAFDHITTDFFGNNEYAIFGANLETGQTATIYENTKLGYPSYSPEDDQLLFSAENTNSEDLLATIPLASNKISASGAPAGLVLGPIWGLWFANGDRDLVGTKEDFTGQAWTVLPNPTTDYFQILTADLKEWKPTQYELRNLMGQTLQVGPLAPHTTILSTEGLAAGNYWISIRNDDGQISTKRLIKL